MEFVHPEILWGLGALAIPIAIHLLHFRRFKRVRFSQVAFLKDVQRDARATQQIRHWWVLLLRLLAFTALIVAANNGHAAAADVLIEAGASVDTSGRNQLTALHAAAGQGHVALVKMLCAHGASVHAATLSHGVTPLM